jgi:hypothetical protein
MTNDAPPPVQHATDHPTIRCSERELAACRANAQVKRADDGRLRHRHSKRGAPSPEYRVWASMIQRCENPARKSYASYGGRGIRVCPAWRLSFEAFLADVGPRPAGTSLDRIDGDGDYEPGNVRWATPLQQANNARTNLLVTFNGETRTRAEWARHLGIKYFTLRQRLDKGWPVEKAFTTPVQQTGRWGNR